jgi:hypothetical protein
VVKNRKQAIAIKLNEERDEKSKRRKRIEGKSV